MNVKKTKTMVVCRYEIPNVRIVVNGQVIEQVKKGRCECQIKNQIEIARSTIL